MRPSTQVITLRFRRACPMAQTTASSCDHNGQGDEKKGEGDSGGTLVEGTLDWPEEQASAEFQGRVFVTSSSSAGDSSTGGDGNATAATAGGGDVAGAGTGARLTLEGKVGKVLQGAPERVSWVAGAEIRGTFCQDGTDGTIKGSWLAKAPATALEPLGPGSMRLNVGLLPDRLMAAEGAGPVGQRSSQGEGSGAGGELQMGSSCR